ncbi:MAG: UMP kinase [Erysipelothrix sp.]|nr:UMP kinase [Erysipelothrix sp.]
MNNKYNRILIKLSGEALSSQDQLFSADVLKSVAEEIKKISDRGVEIAVVVGGGNILRGKDVKDSGIERVHADYMGMLATVMNALALQSSFESVGLHTRVQSAIDMNRVSEPVIVRRAKRHLEKGRVVIFAAGTGNPYFSTDTTAALRASEIGAEVILMAKNGVDGVYSADPKLDASATKYDILTYMEMLNKNLAVMDATASSMCMENDMNVIVFNMDDLNNISRIIDGETVGTLITKEEN